MSPLFVNVENANRRRMSVDSTANLINNDLTSSIISISSEETTTVETSYSSKLMPVLGKNFSYLIATVGNITAQMIISTTVAKTPWSKENIINSLLFNGGLIALDTLSEPHIFSALAKIKNWMIAKWKNNENDITLKKELMKVTTVLLALSYSGVLLDRASNHLLDNWFSVEIIEQTGVEFLNYFLNSTFYAAIISTLEKGIKLSWGKLKNLFSHDNNINIESEPLHDEQNINVATEENNNFFCQKFFPLCLITPVSVFITWSTEEFISNQEFTFKKMVTDAPKVTAGIILSLGSSLINCMVNKEEIPFLPKISTIKKWFCYQQNNDTVEEQITGNLVTSSEQEDIMQTSPPLLIATAPSPCSISEPTDSCSISSEEFKTPIEEWGSREQLIKSCSTDSEEFQTSFEESDNSDNEEQLPKNDSNLFNSKVVNNYQIPKNDYHYSNSTIVW